MLVWTRNLNKICEITHNHGCFFLLNSGIIGAKFDANGQQHCFQHSHLSAFVSKVNLLFLCVYFNKSILVNKHYQTTVQICRQLLRVAL
jgi:hypothetical protein